jgi:deazaflavin-dependent oxidoreductase (nitroreductase family)
MGRLTRAYGRISPSLAHKPGSTLASRAHAWLIRRSGGRIGTRFFSGSRLLVLRTIGRRSGQPRESPMVFIDDGNLAIVCASNAASERPPAWWLNLQAQPEAEALIRGEWRRVRARAATDEETARLWPRLQATYEGFDHYAALATRPMPVVILEPAPG